MENVEKGHFYSWNKLQNVTCLCVSKLFPLLLVLPESDKELWNESKMLSEEQAEKHLLGLMVYVL